MAEELLRLPPGTLKGWGKRGGVEITTQRTPEVTGSESLSELQKLFGKNFFGPEAAEKAFGIKISPKEIPDVPFTKAELLAAKDLNQMLVLRVDKAQDRSPLTMVKIQQMLQGKFQQGGNGKILYDTEWYKNEDFFTKDAPRPGWALVSKELIPGSTSINYLQQTDLLVSYLQRDIFKGTGLPQKYQEAIAEFTKQRKEIEGLMGSNWQEAAKRLSQLKLNHLTRQLPVEVLYDLLMCFQNTGERPLPDKVTWTSRRASDGYLVLVGYFDSGGLYVPRWPPGLARGFLGVCLSR